jgi:hypothetical protein
MQKALFLNLVLPLLAYMAAKQKLPGIKSILLLSLILGMLFLAFNLELPDELASARVDSGDFMSALYRPSSPLEFLIWRAFAVPIFTAADTLVVHTEQFGNRLLLGSTSSLIASVLGVERINLERFVFEHQFGGWNDLGNSNAAFVADLYVNFGWVGTFIFGILVGVIFRLFAASRDIGFRCMWPIFAFGLYNASLIGMLLSNGFMYMLFHGLFIRVRASQPAKQAPDLLSQGRDLTSKSRYVCSIILN